MFYKSMFYKSMFYKSMFYKSSPCFTSPVHSLQVQSRVQSMFLQHTVHFSALLYLNYSAYEQILRKNKQVYESDEKC
jgi:hypothetical protein